MRLYAQTDRTPGETQARIQRLIAELGHDSYNVREQAAHELAKLGPSAREALEKASQSEDREVSNRASRILAVLQQTDEEKRIAAHRARIASFAADLDGAQGQTLLGWDAFRKLFDDQREARALFARMHGQEPQLMLALDRPAQEVATLYEARVRELKAASTNHDLDEDRDRLISFPDLLALVFVGAQNGERISPEAQEWVSDVLIDGPFIKHRWWNYSTQRIREQLQSPSLKKLLAGWITRDCADRYVLIRKNLLTGIRLEVKEAVVPALQVIQHKEHFDANYLDRAVRTLQLYGDAAHCQSIEPLLTDRRQVYTVPINGESMGTLVCDSALVTLVHLSDQDWSDYGIEYLFGREDLRLRPYPRFRFPNPAARTAAMAKWREWKSRQADETPTAKVLQNNDSNRVDADR
jgi:hypothetical protein